MKKLYSFALAAAVAISASAFDLNVKGLQLREASPVKSETSHMKVVTSMKKVSDKIDNSVAKAPQKAAPISELVGTWEFQLGDYYFQTSTGSSLYVEFYASVVSGNQLFFEDPTNYELPFLGTYDETSGTITFTAMILGSTTQYTIKQQPFEYNYTTKDLDSKDVVGTYNATSQSISFPADNGIAWEAYNDEACTDMAGYFSIYDLEGAVKSEGSVGGGDDTGWIYIGEASFEDAWILPGFSFDRSDPAYVYNVPLQRSETDSNIYRLVDPYHAIGFPAIQGNSSKTVGYIMIDVTDPAHVVINANGVEAGFANSSAGITQLYCFNSLGMYAAQGYDPSFVVSVLGDEMPITTFTDGVITLGYYDGIDGREYDANFGIQSAKTGGYQWQDNAGNPIDMSGKIVFPEGWNGVNDVMTDNNANAPVEYFNLQGVRVDNPAAGQLIIRKQGKEVSKVLVK